MDKQAYEEKVKLQEQASRAKMKALSDEVAAKVEADRITKPDSPYRPFEVGFSANRLNEINDFISALYVADIANIKAPLLLLCNKFLAWKAEVGSDRLFHELNIRYDGGKYAENDEGSTYVIKKAWEEVKKEQEIIETARQKHKAWLYQQKEDDPALPGTDPAKWISMCNSFSELEALQEFGYPQPFNTIFGEYKPRPFYYGKRDESIKFFAETE